MNEKIDSSFTVPVPREIENVYELVVIAALRARQLNQYPHLRDRDRSGTLIDQALGETIERKVVFELGEPEAPKVGTEMFEG